MDTLNDHECMATLITLIQYMHDNKIIAKPDDATSQVLINLKFKYSKSITKNGLIFFGQVLPPWMESIRKRLIDMSTHRNVKLFLLRLILNCERVRVG